MRKIPALVLVAALLPVPARAGTFESRMDKLLGNPCLSRGKVCVSVKSMGTGRTYYQRNQDEPMIPASNMKIITAAAALSKLKPWYKFSTAVSYTGEKKGGVITGDLVVSGRGDPHLVSEEMWLMAGEIRKRGITRVTGSLVLDDGFFDSEPFPSGWNVSSIHKSYEAPTGALSLNFNTITVMVYPPDNENSKPIVATDPQTPYFTVVNHLSTADGGRAFVAIRLKPRPGGGETLEVLGRVRPRGGERAYYRAVTSPTQYFGQTFLDMLQKEGVSVGGGIVHSQPLQPTRKLFVHYSRPLMNQVTDMNKYSNNFMAEQLLKTLGAEEVSVPGTVDKGLSVVEKLLRSWGFTNKFELSDGSGLSRSNRVTCSLLVDVLGRMYKEWDGGPEFISSLAVMGKDGSARKRKIMPSKPIRVKTGTLDAVSSLSGYYPLSSGEVLGFSIIFNQRPCGKGMEHHLQNRLVLELETVHDAK
jgi:D-alanyl-D-alanine carboxypeptidase/D-alanyl-D-alanine-endopeptidase (penicillin-binding protein 4)